MKNKNISIIIPTYNERENIKLLIEIINKSLGEHLKEIVVVDDDSPDKTWQKVDELLRNNKTIHLYRRTKEKGLVSALNFGIKKAQGEIVGWLDADFSHPPKYFAKMRNYFPAYDVVIASRYIKDAADKRNNFLPIVFSWIINKIAQTFLYSLITDYTSGFILVKRKLFQDFSLKGEYGEYFIDMLATFKGRNFKIKEIPYISVPRRWGVSKTATGFWDFIIKGRRYLLVIVVNFLLKWILRSKK